MPDGQNLIPKRHQGKRALQGLATKADQVTVFRLPVRESTPDPESPINAWIDWASGQLKFRSPDGTVQTLGTGGHGGTGAIEGSVTYTSEELVLTPTAVGVFPARTDNHLAFGPGVASLLLFAMPALTPAGAEILEVELFLQSLEGTNSDDNEVYVGGDLLGGSIPGSYPSIASSVSYGNLGAGQGDWFNISRTFGEKLRDDVWDALVITPHKVNPQLVGVYSGLNDVGSPPMLRITYASEV